MTALLDPARYLSADELDPAPSNHRVLWTVLTAIEVALATAAVLLDVIVPSLVLLAMAGVSLLIRRRGFGSLGFHRVRDGGGLVLKMLAFAAAWSLFQLAVTMPIANHVSGRTTDLSDFEGLEGNLAMLAGLLALSWTVAAVGEELAYRGYLQTRLRKLVGSTSAGLGRRPARRPARGGACRDVAWSVVLSWSVPVARPAGLSGVGSPPTSKPI